MTRQPLKPALVADLFCGAGGSSTGAKRALDRLGRGMTLTCVNHWPIAIESHSRNHPEARHYVQDIASVRPIEVVPEGYLDLLMASPTCTHHSRARGGKPTSDQQRSDPWHVITWLTELRVKRLLIENVPEFEDWGPVDPRSGKPLKSRKGEYFNAWVRALKGLGFRVEWRVINSADLGAYTTRQRLYLIARSDGKPILWPEPTHSKNGVAGLFGGGRKWKPAREIIDWANKGTSIFTRKRPLVEKTMWRILAGAQKFNWPEPFLVILRGTQPGQVNASAKSVDGPIPTISAGGGHVGIAEQTFRPFVCANRTNNVPQTIDGPVPTIVTSGNLFIAQPEMRPFVIGQHGGAVARDVAEPLPTVAAAGAISLTQPIIAPYYGSGSGETCKSIDLPLDTVTAKARFGLVEAVAQPFMLPQHGDGDKAPRTLDIENPVPTVTTNSRIAVVEPFIISPRHARAGAGPSPRSVENPIPTITSGGSQMGVVEPEVHDPSIMGADDFALALEQGRVFQVDGQIYVFDILFRMLDWPELARAMGFSDQEIQYEFAGTKADITRQIGNAVEVNTAEALVHAVMST